MFFSGCNSTNPVKETAVAVTVEEFEEEAAAAAEGDGNAEAAGRWVADGDTACRPYCDTAYFRRQEALAEATAPGDDASRMSVDGDDNKDVNEEGNEDGSDAAADPNGVFLLSLESSALSRAAFDARGPSCNAAADKGDLWDLLDALPDPGLASLFHVVAEVAATEEADEGDFVTSNFEQIE